MIAATPLAYSAPAPAPASAGSGPSLFARADTFFGVCQGLGEDLGISPTLIRLAFLPTLFFFPVQTVAAYFGLAIVVLASRMMFPVKKRSTAKVTAIVPRALIAAPAPAPVSVLTDEIKPLPLAA